MSTSAEASDAEASDADAQNAVLRMHLSDMDATLRALLAGEIDAVIDPRDKSPVLLAQAQKALRESEERYRSIVETANEGIGLLTLDGTFTFVNERLAAMLGCAVHDVVGRSFYDYVPAALRIPAMQQFATALRGLPDEGESALRHHSGADIAVLVRTSAIHDAAGTCVGLLAMITDTTRRDEAERALRESEAAYRQIVENTTDGIFKLDKAGVVVFASARFAEMLGYEPDELVGLSILSVVPPVEQANVSESLRNRERGRMATTDSMYRHKNGTDILVNIAGSALRDEHGRFTGILGVVRDVTERNKLQAELIASDRMASVGTLAAGVAHEINNPLTAVIANLDFVASGIDAMQSGGAFGPTAERLRTSLAEPIADAQEAAERVRLIVRDLKIFSRAPSADASSAVDVNAVLESSLRMAWNEIRHRAALIKDLGDVPAVRADEARLGQVFLNLIMNAAQSLPVGGVAEQQLRVSTRRDGDSVVVEIADSGAGIAPEHIARIFDAFYTTKAVGEGTGLGLAICKRIVTDIGGTLTVRSTLGVGSTFSVTMPIATDMRPVPLPAADGAPSPYRGRTLVIDDELMVARGVTRALDAACGVEYASSAAAALERFDAGERFDVILCDLMMPHMTGMELHRHLTVSLPDQARRIIFMTGGVFTSEAREFVARPDIRLLEKPFGVKQLRSTVYQFAEALRQESI